MLPPVMTISVPSRPSTERSMAIVPPWTSSRASEWMPSSPASIVSVPSSTMTAVTASIAVRAGGEVQGAAGDRHVQPSVASSSLSALEGVAAGVDRERAARDDEVVLAADAVVGRRSP